MSKPYPHTRSRTNAKLNDGSSFSNSNYKLDGLSNSESDNSSSNSELTGKIIDINKMPTTPHQIPQTASLDQVISNFRIPDCIKTISHYDGNKSDLFNFIDSVDTIFSTLLPLVDNNIKAIYNNEIRKKIIGNANDVLNQYGRVRDWEQVKEILINHYADKRDEYSLTRDLHTLHQGNLSAESFFGKVNEVLASLINNISLQDISEDVRKNKIDYYHQLALDCFLTGLNRNIGNIVRAFQPKTLSDAFKRVQIEQNVYYKQSQYTKTPIKINNNVHQSKPTIRHVNMNDSIRPPYINQPPYTIHQTPYNTNLQPRYNYSPVQPYQANPQYSNTFGQPRPQYRPPINNSYNQQKPSTSQSNPHNFNRFNNPQPNKPVLPRPEPMDTSSGNTRRSYHNNMFKPTGPPNFVSQELFNIDPYDTNASYYDSYSEQAYDYHSDHAYPNDYSQYNHYFDTPPDVIENNSVDLNQLNVVEDENFQLTTSTQPDT